MLLPMNPGCLVFRPHGLITWCFTSLVLMSWTDSELNPVSGGFPLKIYFWHHCVKNKFWQQLIILQPWQRKGIHRRSKFACLSVDSQKPSLWIGIIVMNHLIIYLLLFSQTRDGGQRTTIYKRDPSKQYGLKMKTSRMFFSEVDRRFDAMPFTLRYQISLGHLRDSTNINWIKKCKWIHSPATFIGKPH